MSCGPGKFNIDLGKFNGACKAHDKNYENNLGKIKSDLIFLNDLLKISENMKDVTISSFLFLMVVIFGNRFYKPS